MKKFYGFVFFVLLFANFAQAQQQQQRTAEITVSLNERFFDVLLDAVFTNLKAPSFPIASNSPKSKIQSPKSESSILQSNGDNELNGFLKSSFAANEIANRKPQIRRFATKRFGFSARLTACEPPFVSATGKFMRRLRLPVHTIRRLSAVSIFKATPKRMSSLFSTNPNKC